MSTEIFYSSDGHFKHRNIIKYCSRPFKDTDEMDGIMIENWNKVVRPNDIVRYLGDFSLAGPETVMKYRYRMNGIWELFLQGNHDRSSLLAEQSNLAATIIRGKRTAWTGLFHDKQKVILTHYPPVKIRDNNIYLFGHTHQHIPISDNNQKNIINIGVDAWNYSPVSWEEIKLLF